ncbi:multiprotein-bridging factor 1 family protein [Kitasatospora sp. NPDC088548]|uniref:helix-turn-helix domain-containing protein n=1 Tax=Kitasatospora sp. NPDC088548 TaxID=3364075 RepID=UPI0037F66D3D
MRSMLERWDRGSERRLLRAVDAATALLCEGMGPVGLTVLQRLLATAFEAGAGTADAARELQVAGDIVNSLCYDEPWEESQARAWLADAHLQRAALRATAAGADPVQARAELESHRCWEIHQLDALARRLRLLHTASGQSAKWLADSARVEYHHIARWTAGRTRPDARQRTALARTLGVASGWFGVQRDAVPDIDLYRSLGGCPCGAGADRFALGAVNGQDLKTSWTSQGWYCVGCGTPWMAEHDGRLYAAPVLSPAGGELKFLAVLDTVKGPAACGPELTLPWPPAHWSTPAGLHRRGAAQVPALYRAAPPRP